MLCNLFSIQIPVHCIHLIFIILLPILYPSSFPDLLYPPSFLSSHQYRSWLWALFFSRMLLPQVARGWNRPFVVQVGADLNRRRLLTGERPPDCADQLLYFRLERLWVGSSGEVEGERGWVCDYWGWKQMRDWEWSSRESEFGVLAAPQERQVEDWITCGETGCHIFNNCCKYTFVLSIMQWTNSGLWWQSINSLY